MAPGPQERALIEGYVAAGLRLGKSPTFLNRPVRRRPAVPVLVDAEPEPAADPVIAEPDWISPKAPRWRRITFEVAAQRGIEVGRLLSAERSVRVVAARFNVFYRLERELGMSRGQIGKKFGRDHTTVSHGISVHAKRLCDASSASSEIGLIPTVPTIHPKVAISFLYCLSSEENGQM